MTESEIAELAKMARVLGYTEPGRIVNRLERMLERNKVYLEYRKRRGTHTSHDDTVAEDMAVIALVIERLEGKA